MSSSLFVLTNPEYRHSLRCVPPFAARDDLISLLMQPSRSHTARSDARRPVATRDHRRFPLGWTAPDVSELTGVPKRTLQVWRKGFFVPALPPDVTKHAER